MSDYQNAVVKLANLGLNISVPPDLVGDAKYTRLANIRTLQEGQLTTRFGLEKWASRPPAVPATSTIVYMGRINSTQILFVWSSGEVYVNDDPLLVYDYYRGVGNPRGSVPRQELVLTFPDDYDVEGLRGAPAVENVSVVRFTSKISGEDWAYLATDVGMWKIDKNGIGYRWGIRPPLKISLWTPSKGKKRHPGSGIVVTNAMLAGTTSDVRGIPPPEYIFEETRFDAPQVVTCPPDVDGHRDCGLNSIGDLKIPYVWVYTYYSSMTGAESNACGEMASQIAIDSQAIIADGGECPDPVPTEGAGSECQKAVKLTGFEFPTDPQVDRYRIYRKGGGLPSYHLEDEIPVYSSGFMGGSPNQTTFYISYKYDVSIAGNQPLSDDNYMPFSTVVSPSGTPDPNGLLSSDPLLDNGITGPETVFEVPMGRAWGPYQGAYIFATGDTHRPGIVYWTNVGSPDGASLLNELQVTSSVQPLTAGFIFGGNSFVWSKDELYALDYSGQTTPEFIPRQIPMGLGLSAPNAFAVGPSGVYFLSKDGIYVTDCTSFANPITKDSLRPIFLGQAASEFLPLDWDRAGEFRMSVVSQELHFLYVDLAGANQHLVFDIQQNRWQKFEPASSLYATALFGDVNTAQYQNLLALSNGSIYNLSYSASGADEVQYDTPVKIRSRFRTGAADAGSPLTQKEFGVLMIDADMPAAAGCVVTPLYDAEQVTGTSFSLSTVGRQTKTFSLSDLYKKNVSLDMVWDGLGTIYQVVFLWRLDEEEIVHWFAPADSLGIRGWKHVRDGYFGLRSTAPVTLTVEVDSDQTYTYTLPSTGGELLSQHIWFEPTKGKMFLFSLDSTQPFRVYADDTFVNVKQWNTANSYTPFKIGGAGGYSL